MKKSVLKIFKSIPTLKTERLVLKKIELGDLSDVHEYTSDPSVSKYLAWYPHKTQDYTRAYLSYIFKLYKKGKFYDWGVFINGKMIGTVGFSSIDIKNDSAQIGYVLNSSYWGKGIATEAVREILKFGFSNLELKRIEAVLLPENLKSKRVLAKCSLKFKEVRKSFVLVKGEYSDAEIFEINKEEYLRGINT